MPSLTSEQRLALKKIKHNDVVLETNHNYYRVRVKFKSGITETWVLRGKRRYPFAHDFPTENLLSKRGLPIYSEFETHPLNKEETEFLKPFFIIQRKDINKAGFVDIRLAVHKIIVRLIEEGWIRLRYPTKVLQEDLELLGSMNFESFFTGPGQVGAFSSPPGRAILEHFLDWGTYTNGRRSITEAWNNSSCLYAAIQSLLKSKKDITRTNIVRGLSFTGGRRNSGPKFINPGIYCSIIDTFFKKSRSIYDREPGLGSKMLAASVLKRGYVCEDPQNGLLDAASFVSCLYGQRTPDLAILSDNNPIPGGEAVDLLDSHHERYANMLIMVSHDDLEMVTSKHPPRRVLKTHMCPKVLMNNIGHHHFLLY